ncbi:MAG: GAF domain-containing sensor histidine kinase [Acidobacteria bacterium]|nr:GAF domain-containing sensor histidine kinase [Acidobacteriota bacterium]
MVAEVASAMLLPLELQQVLNIAVEKVSTNLGAAFGSIALLSPDRRTLQIKAVYNLAPDYAERINRTAPIPADNSSIAGRAVEARRPCAVSDVMTDPIFTPWREVAGQEGYRSLICAPLIVGADAVGTLNQYLAEPHHFSSHEVRLLTVVSQQVCLAIERAHLYEELKRQTELARSASERKSRFCADMSNELRTPLTAIIGFAELLLEHSGPLDDVQARQVRMILSSAQHLSLLLNDALDLSRIEAGKMECAVERVDAGQVVLEAMRMMTPLAEAKGLQLEWEGPEKPLVLRCDRQKCKQILVNLISNAVKFTARGGIRVRGGRNPADPKMGLISVADTGIGIRPEDLPRLFQEFQQLETPLGENDRGSGLGLSLSRRMARLMGGDIEVESRYRQGSTFTLKLEAVP